MRSGDKDDATIAAVDTAGLTTEAFIEQHLPAHSADLERRLGGQMNSKHVLLLCLPDWRPHAQWELAAAATHSRALLRANPRPRVVRRETIRHNSHYNRSNPTNTVRTASSTSPTMTRSSHVVLSARRSKSPSPVSGTSRATRLEFYRTKSRRRPTTCTSTSGAMPFSTAMPFLSLRQLRSAPRRFGNTFGRTYCV